MEIFLAQMGWKVCVVGYVGELPLFFLFICGWMYLVGFVAGFRGWVLLVFIVDGFLFLVIFCMGCSCLCLCWRLF